MTPSGIEIDERDDAIRPADDLYRHINERWIERTPIPEDRARYGSFHVLAEEAEKAVREIIEECQSAADGTEARKVGDLYTSFMNVDAVNALGASPLKPLLRRIEGVEGLAEFMSALGEFERDGIGSFVSMWVDNDPGDPERYLVFVEQSGIGLPDESYFRDETFASIREAYRGHLERMFAISGFSDAADRAARVCSCAFLSQPSTPHSFMPRRPAISVSRFAPRDSVHPGSSATPSQAISATMSLRMYCSQVSVLPASWASSSAGLVTV